MAIDLAQFHQVFFEESLEGLAIMESGLLGLETGDADPEAINAIFRAAHSMKGGSATFGFTAVADFAHHLETLLDEMREGRRPVTAQAVEALLGSVDCLRDMLGASQSGRPVDRAAVAIHQAALERLLADDAVGAPTPVPVPVPALAADRDEGWQIVFSPHRDLFRSGNDPARIFRELAGLGRLEVDAELGFLPSADEMDIEDCYLAWELKLYGKVARADIDEAFAWVEDHCDLAVRSLAELAALAAAAVPVPAPQEAASMAAAVQSASVPQPETGTKNAGGGSIRVDTAKIDQLINLCGELVITQSMLGLLGETFTMDRLEQLQNGLAQLERHTRALQESVMNIRMLPISFVFSRMPRLVHDISGKLGKRVELRLMGEQTELDKTVIEQIADPLMHLVRNSLDHGIEAPHERVAAGKPDTGLVLLNAYHRGGNIVIEVSDDGRGLDASRIFAKAVERGLLEPQAHPPPAQLYDLIFHPGFSTAEQVTEVSGRGVGMDVVRRNIEALGGRIELKTQPGQGSTFSIHLPLTLAILDGQTVAVGKEIYIAPLVSIIESISLTEDKLNTFTGKGETFRLRGEYLPIIRLHEVFGVEGGHAVKLTDGLLMVVEGQGLKCGLFVDNVLSQQQVVIKSLEENYRRVEGISGATILGDGSVALILDIPGLVRLARQERPAQTRH
ncbi:two-component system, chemotaxis family, sensor kinase CheA [Methylomagnum ishizawai]|uniref:Chemotaxis protein CheA n=1 Tax=Methylomagnum ishizawai TaxID=1760988 RepID=A0A1Y6D0N2_9GAMM|nr:chemotaxis protein CheA [Methylomagnum ishizawai]SMF94112.1 two-component system, chemotaxis family, sensor kinase CheA [Methylomagnum ishizawai]